MPLCIYTYYFDWNFIELFRYHIKRFYCKNFSWWMITLSVKYDLYHSPGRIFKTILVAECMCAAAYVLLRNNSTTLRFQYDHLNHLIISLCCWLNLFRCISLKIETAQIWSSQPTNDDRRYTGYSLCRINTWKILSTLIRLWYGTDGWRQGGGVDLTNNVFV